MSDKDKSIVERLLTEYESVSPEERLQIALCLLTGMNATLSRTVDYFDQISRELLVLRSSCGKDMSQPLEGLGDFVSRTSAWVITEYLYHSRQVELLRMKPGDSSTDIH